jgi:hypothetical protein
MDELIGPSSGIMGLASHSVIYFSNSSPSVGSVCCLGEVAAGDKEK